MTHVEVEILIMSRVMGNCEELSCVEQFDRKALAVTQLNTDMEHNKELH